MLLIEKSGIMDFCYSTIYLFDTLLNNEKDGI